MTEVVFSQGETGGLKWLKEKKEAAVGEIVFLGLMLDVGDISGSIEDRKGLMLSLFRSDTDSEEAEKRVGKIYAELYRLMELIKNGETVRVWYMERPEALCGLYYLCNLMRYLPNEIRTVKMPEYRISGEYIITYSHWGELEPEVIEEFMSRERTLTGLERTVFANNWNFLKRDNYPLRVIINGHMVGVTEAFYDFLIYRALEKEPLRYSLALGIALSYVSYSVSERWVGLRMDRLIETGDLEVIEDVEDYRNRLIARKNK